MIKIENINKLSREKLTKALLFTVLGMNEEGRTRNELNSYYDLLSLEDLRNKAKSLDSLFMEDESIPVDSREIKRRERFVETKKPVVIHKTILYEKIEPQLSNTEEMISELMACSWVSSAVEVAKDVIGVRLSGASKINAVAERIRYNGIVIVNSKIREYNNGKRIHSS